MSAMAFAKPWLAEEEAQAAQEAILSGWVTQGPRVREFEAAFAACTQAPCACAVSNCTSALHLALLAVGVRPGDTVITVSHSFIATANAIRHCQAEPWFVDIDPATLNMAPGALQKALDNDFTQRDGVLFLNRPECLATQAESPFAVLRAPLGRLAAILVVHQAGMPADLSKILSLARPLGIPVVEDAACAIGSELSLDGGLSFEGVGQPHADVACFSFHPRKILTTGDGGMLTTRDPEMDRRFRLLRQHGMSLSDLERHRAGTVQIERYLVTGHNYRMTDIQAAVGLAQLTRLPEILRRRRATAAAYGQNLARVPGVTPPSEPAYARSNWQTYMVRLGPSSDQLAVMQRLLDKGVPSRRGIMCAHLEPPYASAWPEGCLPHSEEATRRCIALPMHHEMDASACATVARTLKEVLHP